MSPWRQGHVKSFRMACAIFTNTRWIFLEQLLCTKWKSKWCLKICFSIVSINSSCSRHSVYIRCSLTLFHKQLFLCFAARKPSFKTFPKYFPISKTNVSQTSAVHPVRDLELVLDLYNAFSCFFSIFERSLMQSDNMLLDWPRKQESHDDGAYYKSFIKVLGGKEGNWF